MIDYKKIINIVEKEADTIDSLLLTMKKKQESIISLTVDNLKSSINEEIKLVSLTKWLENERLSLLNQFVGSEMDSAKMTMSDIIKSAPETDSAHLQKLKGRLQKSLDELKHVNDTNMLLLERSKKFIKENISILTCYGEKQLVNKRV